MKEQYANINLSRQTLERLQDDLWSLTAEEAEQVNQALQGMKDEDNLEKVNIVAHPPGTFSHPNK